MIHGKYINQGEDLTDVLKVRQLSLCDGVNGNSDGVLADIDVSTLLDDLDPLAVNILVDIPEGEDEDGPRINIGCGRILCDVDHFRFYIDQMGILPAYRHKGFGEFALRMLVDKANVCGADKIWLKLPSCWTLDSGCSFADTCKTRAMSFFTKMKFVPAENADAEGEWMVADISDFHNCCH